jgi:hypothetical protein
MHLHATVSKDGHRLGLAAILRDAFHSARADWNAPQDEAGVCLRPPQPKRGAGDYFTGAAVRSERTASAARAVLASAASRFC